MDGFIKRQRMFNRLLEVKKRELLFNISLVRIDDKYCFDSNDSIKQKLQEKYSEWIYYNIYLCNVRHNM